jgi:lysophospholipase L1-like esterase
MMKTALATWPLLPLLAAQGLWLRRCVPRLPDAAGPCEGVTGATSERPLRLIVLGDSTVAGVGAAHHEEALAGQMALSLHRRLRRPVRWLAVGRSGATAATAGELLAPKLAGCAADALAVSLGVNDVKRLHSPARWQRDLARLLALARGHLGDIPIVLAGIPPMSQFPALPQPLRFTFGLRSTALDRAGAGLLANNPRARHVPFRRLENAPGFFARDGFHPAPRGYAAIGAALAEAAAQLLI